MRIYSGKGEKKPARPATPGGLPYPSSDIKLAVLLGSMFQDPALLERSGYLNKLYTVYTHLTDFQYIEERDKADGRWAADSLAQQKYLT